MISLELPSKRLLRCIYGIDFSGAKDAGKKIWIAGGTIEGEALKIEECMKAEELEGSGRERGKCHAALLEFITKDKNSAFGLDFPFGLPIALVRENCWEEFILAFPENYKSSMAFREKCFKASYSHELKRLTDIECMTPFSPYNLRVYRQTYYGIHDILNPLVRKEQACILPMQRQQSGKPWILEICPASTLKTMNLYRPYKGKVHREQRAAILDAIELTGSLSVNERTIREKIMEDIGGDALDSVIAAYSTFRAISAPVALNGSAYRAYLLEGHVYL